MLPDEVLGLVNSPQIRGIMDSATAMKQGGVVRLLYPTTAMQFSDTVYIMREMPGGDPNGYPKIVTGRSPEPLAERGIVPQAA